MNVKGRMILADFGKDRLIYVALGDTVHELLHLMSDLRGFPAMSERMAAHSLISMLNHYLGEMTEIIQRRNGTIIEFIGGGILAIFGAPSLRTATLPTRRPSRCRRRWSRSTAGTKSGAFLFWKWASVSTPARSS